MAQLLIVDDEFVAVQAIICSLDWDKIGIPMVFSAYNINQAKEIFCSQVIDIMLSDIEMPQGNGIELLRWVRENYPRTECIFLTCHSDFKYAKQAIELGSLDYLLKPVSSEELEVVIAKALNKITKDNELFEHSQSGYLWDKHKHYIIERFWLDVFSQKISSTPKEIKQAALVRNIDSPEDQVFIPIIIKIKRWYENMGASDEKLMEYALKNIAEEIILKENKNGLVIELSQGILIGIIVKNNCRDFSPDILKEDCALYIKESVTYLRCDLCCYIGRDCFAIQMAGEVNRLLEKDKNNVAYVNKAFLPEHNVKAQGQITLPDINVWMLLLNEGLQDRLVSEASDYLKNLVDKSELDINMLRKIQQDFIQMIHTYLRQRNVQAHQFLAENQSTELFAKATYSVSDMITWIGFVVDKSMNYLKTTKQNQTLVEKAKKFIEAHIAEELTREEVAAHVYLNPDYLTRVFRKETGMSLPEYVFQERLKIAKELLLKTNMSINTVASYVGYQNSAHFARAFKKHVHMCPAEYRVKEKSEKGMKEI